MASQFDKKLDELKKRGVSLGTKKGEPEVIRSSPFLETIQKYTGGTIYLRTDLENGAVKSQTAFAVWGAIHAKWQQIGGMDGPLGAPHTDELPTPDKRGRFNHFKGGSIYWTPQTGAHIVWGAIRGLWSRMSWERGPLGYPLTDEIATPKPKDYGRFNHFEGGSIYWTPATGAQYVPKDIFAEWAKLGHERHDMGFPVPKHWGKRTKFLHGNIPDGDLVLFEGGYIFRDSGGNVQSIVYKNLGTNVWDGAFKDGKLDEEIEILYKGFHCLRESDADGLSDSDEPYFVFTVTDGDKAKARQFGPFSDVDSGESRAETSPVGKVLWRYEAETRVRDLEVVLNVAEWDGSGTNSVLKVLDPILSVAGGAGGSALGALGGAGGAAVGNGLGSAIGKEVAGLIVGAGDDKVGHATRVLETVK